MNPAEKPGFDVVEAYVPLSSSRGTSRTAYGDAGPGDVQLASRTVRSGPGKSRRSQSCGISPARRDARGGARALAVGVLAGCTKSRTAVSGVRHRGRKPDVLRIAIQTDLKESQPAAQLQYDRRLRRPPDVRAAVTADPKGNPLPMLAAQVPTLPTAASAATA